MTNWRKYILAAAAVATAVGFGHIKNSHRNIPVDFRDAVADNGKFDTSLPVIDKKNSDIPEPKAVPVAAEESVSADGARPIKTCSAVIVSDGSRLASKIEVFKKADSFEAKVTQKKSGQSNTYHDVVTIYENKVRAGVAQMDPYDESASGMNDAERLVSHAISLTSDPVFKNAYSAGLDLKQVRFAKVYTVGKTSEFGSTSIIEAKDESGKPLGSFLGGFLVAKCE